MGWTDPGVLDAHLRRLDGEAVGDFVEDLWTAREFETEREGSVVRARRGDETRVLYLFAGRDKTPSTETAGEIDAIVAPRRSRASEALATEHGARLLDSSGLAEMLRYAVGREDAARLCERHLGATPERLRLPVAERARRAVSTFGARAVVLVVALVAVVGAGAVLGPGVPGAASSGSTGDVGGSEIPTAAGGDAPLTRTAESDAGPTGSGVTDPSTVPGVNEAGISNASRLGQAHAATVSMLDAYTIWFDYYAPEDGGAGQVQYDADVRVQGEQASVVTSLERSSGDRSVIERVYFDGSVRFVAENGSDDFSRVDTDAPTATPRAVPFTRPAVMVRTYLATPESSASYAGSDGARERYRLRGTGRPAGLPETVEDYEMTAVVDERGFVWSFEADFTVRRDSDGDGVGGRERVRLTWTYDRIGTTEVRLDP